MADKAEKELNSDKFLESIKTKEGRAALERAVLLHAMKKPVAVSGTLGALIGFTVGRIFIGDIEGALLEAALLSTGSATLAAITTDPFTMAPYRARPSVRKVGAIKSAYELAADIKAREVWQKDKVEVVIEHYRAARFYDDFIKQKSGIPIDEVNQSNTNSIAPAIGGGGAVYDEGEERAKEESNQMHRAMQYKMLQKATGSRFANKFVKKQKQDKTNIKHETERKLA